MERAHLGANILTVDRRGGETAHVRSLSLASFAHSCQELRGSPFPLHSSSVTVGPLFVRYELYPVAGIGIPPRKDQRL